MLYWRVLDLEKAYYKVQDLQGAISNLVLTQLRSEMGKLSLNETFTARTEVNETLLRELDVATAPWGVKVTRVELLDIVPSKLTPEQEAQGVTLETPKVRNSFVQAGFEGVGLDSKFRGGQSHVNLIAISVRYQDDGFARSRWFFQPDLYFPDRFLL